MKTFSKTYMYLHSSRVQPVHSIYLETTLSDEPTILRQKQNMHNVGINFNSGLLNSGLF